MNTPAVRQYLSAADPVMAAIIESCPNFEISTPQQPTLYESLCRTIVSQQLSTKAAAVIYQRFLGLFHTGFPLPADLLATPEATLRSAGLSGQKARYLHNIAQFWIDRQLHDYDFAAQSDEAILSLLTEIKGVGKWTVEMILMFNLYRPDVFSIGDLGIRKSIAKRYGLDIADKMFVAQATDIARAWQPYRTVACRYLWHDLDN